MRVTERPPSTAVAEAEYPSAWVAWSSVGVLLLMYALSFMDRQVVSLLVGDLRRDLGVDDFQISLLQGFAFALLYSVLGVPFGMAVDRFPRRNVILFGVLVWASAATACGLAHSYGQLLFARSLVGAGEAALAPAAYSMLSELLPKRRLTLALSVYAVGAQFGSEASLALGGLIVHAAEHGVMLPVLGLVPAWRFAFLVTGAPGLVLAFAIFLIPEPRRRTVPGGAPWSEVLAFMRARWGFFACQFVGFAMVIGLAYARLAWAPAYLGRHFGWPIDKIGLVLSAFNLVTGVVCLTASGAIVDFLFHRGFRDAHFRFYVVGSVVLMVAGPLSFLAPNPWIFFLLSVANAMWLGMAGVGASAVQLVTPAEYRGRISAIYLMVISIIGLTLGPSMVGLLTDRVFHDPAKLHLSLATTFAVLSPIALVAFALGLKPMRRAVAAASAF
ncbi:MAG: transporter [Phenylobacterium sp.]|nr:transporter [Phenylobacterium sp.]